MRLYGAGKESRDSDNESDGSDGTGGLEEEDEEEDGCAMERGEARRTTTV